MFRLRVARNAKRRPYQLDLVVDDGALDEVERIDVDDETRSILLENPYEMDSALVTRW